MSDAGPASSPDTPRATPQRQRQHEEGAKVIFEQILVALILAFIFRAFVLEAFVIPTGSMATTLLGAHMRFTCPDCGWRFPVNYPTDTTTQAVRSQPQVYAIRCPNCAYRLPRHMPEDPENDASDPPVWYGDRILVLKHAYLLEEPQRWHVVVFKNPSRSGDEYRGLPDWSTEPYQQNYIKRLIGLPGETIMLLDGDVYVNDSRHTPTMELRPEDFEIARKPPVAQSALWRVVYDDDHRPQGRERTYQDRAGTPFSDRPWEMPWRQAEGEGWQVVPGASGGGFAFSNLDGEGTLRFEPRANPHALPFTDFLTYNVNAAFQMTNRDYNQRPEDTFDRDFATTFAEPYGHFRLNTVSDLRLLLHYEKLEGEGPLLLRLTKRGDVFEALISDGRARVTGTSARGEPMFEHEVPIAGSFEQPRRIEFINADYRVQLLVDGRLVFETTDAEYAPDVAALVDFEESGALEAKPEVLISARRQTARLTHVSLWRDVYHTARTPAALFDPFNPYASPDEFPRNVIRLGEREYFTLGDNPALSADARGWIDGLSLPYEGELWVSGGRVPGRFMLGRAFFVYWPASFRPVAGLPAVVPNVGDMRFIR